VEIGESSFTYLQIFYSLDYGIPLLSYKIVCWVLALIFHIGCHIKDFKSTILSISQKMSGLDTYDLPKSLETRFPNEDDVPWISYFFLLLQLFSLTHKFLKSLRSLKPYWQGKVKV